MPTAKSEPAVSSASPPQLTIDQRFHAQYGAACATAVADPPVFVVLAESIVAFVRAARRERPFSPPAINVLKAAAHAPLAAFCATLGVVGRPLGDAAKRALGAVRDTAVLSDEDVACLPASTVDDVRRAYAMAREHAAHLLGEGGAARATLEAFARDAGPVLLRLAEHGTRLQLESLHAIVEEELASLDDDEKRALRVVVAGVHQARARNLAMQYFGKRLGEAPSADDRLTYAEGVQDADEARLLVAKQAVDRVIASSFFGDPKRLQRDVLGDAAARLLGRMDLPRIP